MLGREPVGELAGPVRRAVVDHEHAVVGRRAARAARDHRLEVLALVVGGEADGRACGTRPIIAAMAATLPRNAEVAEQLELLADMLELEGAGVVPRARLPARRAARARDGRLDRAARARRARRKELQGIGKTIEEKIVQIVEDGEIQALDEAAQADAAGRRRVHPPPRASGRRPRGGSGRSSA